MNRHQLYSLEELQFCLGLSCTIEGRKETDAGCFVEIYDILNYENTFFIVIEIPQYDKVRNTRLGRLLFL